MSCLCLKISNFPDNLSQAEKIDLIKHFGATQVNCVGQKKSIIFATFENESSTACALKRLHQLDILGSKLVVIYAKKKSDDWTEVPGEDAVKNSIDEKDSQKCYEKFLHSLNAWSLPMDLGQPPPSHLLYLYPPPTMEVIANIARALVAVPKFYNQVLHLMNRMNLLSPFHSSSPQFHAALSSLFGEKSSLATHDDGLQMQSATEEVSQKSTSESELESDPEPEVGIPNYIPMKRKAPEKRTGVKRPKLIRVQKNDEKLLTKSAVMMADVFEVRSKEPQKNITMKLNARPEVEEETPSELASGQGFGVLFPVVPESTEAEVPVEVEVEDESYISLSKIRSNRISERDQGMLPVYKNYQPGAPSSRLYIKNLAKNTTARELHYIFRAFLGHKPTDEEDNKTFDLLHMTEGRMKGQAFVTFPTVAQAQRALREVNGYILNDKPMVIQFGRSKVQTASNVS